MVQHRKEIRYYLNFNDSHLHLKTDLHVYTVSNNAAVIAVFYATES